MAYFLARASFALKRPSSVMLAAFSCAFILVVYFSAWRLVGCSSEGCPEPFRSGEIPERNPPGERFECNRESPLTDYCTLRGDVRVDFRAGEIFLVARHPDTPRGSLAVRPYARKWDAPVMATVTEQKLRAVDARAEPALAPRCTADRDSPGVLFSAGGHSGAIFHDFNEVLLPLFQTTQAFQREVTLIISDLKGPWWFRAPPAESFAGTFTRHPIKLMGSSRDTAGKMQGVGCFPSLIVGLKDNFCLYDELGGRDERSEMNSVHAFRRGEVPLLCMVQRQTTRRLTNYDALRAVALNAGFKVSDVVFENLAPRESVRTMRACDSLVGVHGAGLSNTLFMRPGSVLLQIIPFGEHAEVSLVGREFRNVADVIGFAYSECNVPAENSSLWARYKVTDRVLADPRGLWEEDADKAMKMYHSQDVSVPETVFEELLREMRGNFAFHDAGAASWDAFTQSSRFRF
ncbi:Glycosyltransferase family 61 protein [Klebsormidium nitens]|uniref:Glycosyltransferase family 61 protein n=1 Tax=Klebsormidium nitens TaxID=105231 RepID=A0A1Y1HPW5_KLENI|nr:Glycosyltransferase family 61 protein [Klebsormidium nitens]|eukprot:GAQ80674.1 Glycosyltransferase family 61 protein [Klebsormidium nitens]